MNKVITLLGMSGAGKTHFSARMVGWGWSHYSNDYEIAKRLGISVTVDDLSALSAFVGQVGDVERGGLSLEEFKRRQVAYMDAEMDVLRDMPEGAARLVNDSTGSFCEIEDEGVIAEVAAKSTLVYIETDAASHEEVIQRAVEYPKPLYFPPALFDGWVEEYCEVQGTQVDGIVPNDFSAWVFPKLFASRLPKYERLAAEYGVKVRAQDLHACEDEAQFLALVKK
ncbi:MAG: hypothetical protein ACRBCT_01700 [Alphaproteobacteria bacterium]